MKRLAHYSQYFLRSPQLVKRLVGHTTITKNDVVYDIGAGSGIIASVLATCAKTVVAVEYEPRMAVKLRENMAKYSNVEVVETDFLRMALPEGPYKVFANIPFHLSSPILRKLTESDTPPDAIYLITQRQFANKLLSDSDRFTSQLGIRIGPLFSVRIRQYLKRTDYWPHPNVDTVMVELIRRDVPLIPPQYMPRYRVFIEKCFSDPRQFAKAPRSKVGLSPDIKPSGMTLSQWIILFTVALK